jgi:hypothetical protein
MAVKGKIVDLLTTDGKSEEWIKDQIAKNEKRRPGINDLIYQKVDEIRRLIPDLTDGQLNAALISDCQSDPLLCGRCYIRDKFMERYVAEQTKKGK